MGKEFRKIKSCDGKKLTDELLRSKIKYIFHDIDEVYAAACNHIHFSNRHFWNKVQWNNNPQDPKSLTFRIQIGEESGVFAEKDILKLMNGFIDISQRILCICEKWSQNRCSPFNSHA